MYKNVEIIKHLDEAEEQFSFKGTLQKHVWNQIVLGKWNEWSNKKHGLPNLSILSFEGYDFNKEKMAVTKHDKREIFERSEQSDIYEEWNFTIQIEQIVYRSRIVHEGDGGGGNFSVFILANDEWTFTNHTEFSAQGNILYQFFRDEDLESIIHDELSVEKVRELSK